MNLDEYRRYRATALQKLCASKELVSLIVNQPHGMINGKGLVFRNIFPYPYVPEATTEAKTFVTMTITAPMRRERDRTYNAFSLWIYLFTHYSLVNTPRGLRFDLMAEAVDKLLNGSMDFGLGRMDLVSAEDLELPANFYGVGLQYATQDFKRGSLQA